MMEATAKLGVSRQTVMQRVKRGELKAVLVRQGRRKGLQSKWSMSSRNFFSNQGAVWNTIQELTDVGIEHPANTLRHHARVQRCKRLVRIPPWPEAIGEPQKIDFVDGAEHLGHCALDDFVFQRRHAERPLAPIRFGDINATHRQWPVTSGMYPFTKILAVSPADSAHRCLPFPHRFQDSHSALIGGMRAPAQQHRHDAAVP